MTGTRDTSDPPFRGARPYRSEDRDIFFARERETADLLERLAEHRIVLLYGPAGSGRTSLLEAGLIPGAREQGIEPTRVRLRSAPGNEVEVDDPDAGLLVADRFDDLFELYGSTRQEQVLETLTAKPVVLCFREEQLARVLELLGEREAAHVRLKPPTEVEEIVRGPFRAHPGRFGNELGPSVAAALAKTPLEPAELQTACLRLWEADDPDKLLARHGTAGLLASPGAKPPDPLPRTKALDEDAPLTPEERRLRYLLLAHAAWSAVLAIGYLIGGDTSSLGFVPNSFAKDVLFVALSLLAAGYVRRHGWLAVIISVAYLGLVGGQIATLAWGGAPEQDVLGLFTVSATVALLAWMAVDLILAVWFAAWWIAAVRSRWGLRYLHPIAFLALVSLAEVLIEGEREVVPPRDIARNVDAYLHRLDAKGKQRVQLALIALALWPMLTARPPLPALDPVRRKRFLERRFVADVAKRRTFAPVRKYLQAMIRVGSQMSYLGYYGDRRSWPSVGYQPFSERPGGRPPTAADIPDPALRSLTAPPTTQRYDAIVVGSGAAGGLLAYRFAEAGRRVLVLERGPHVDPRAFTDDEVDQYLRLYNEGALQLATDFRLQVLQGMCVGGGTTINNALCLDPPGPVLDSWQERGIDRAALERSIAEVRRFLPVGRIDEAATTSLAARRFADAAFRLGLPGRIELMEVNISSRCLGCGYCNIGCAYGAKLSMLDTALPWAQERFPGRLDVLPDFEATKIVYEGDRAIAVTGAYGGKDTVTFAADEIVIAAGAVHSSHLLQRSGIGGDAVGRGLHFNINSPLTADFPEPVDAFAGLQMSHAYVPDEGVPGYLIETWFNPPATQALSMPGWFDRHFENMRRYRHMACGGTLVGTTHPGYVHATRSGPEIRYEPSATDLRRLVEGLKVMGRIFLEAGAERVMPATFGWREYRDAAALEALAVRDNADLLLTSAHPQGGNAIGDVVDPDFRVRGFSNLFLCDASVFPSSVHVNPQLTVMGMAQLAATTVLGARIVSAS